MNRLNWGAALKFLGNGRFDALATVLRENGASNRPNVQNRELASLHRLLKAAGSCERRRVTLAEALNLIGWDHDCLLGLLENDLISKAEKETILEFNRWQSCYLLIRAAVSGSRNPGKAVDHKYPAPRSTVF